MTSQFQNRIPLTLFCPVCGAPPVLPHPLLTPWFCGAEECLVLAWDPYSTLQENLMDAAQVTVEEILREDE